MPGGTPAMLGLMTVMAVGAVTMPGVGMTLAEETTPAEVMTVRPATATATETATATGVAEMMEVMK